MRTLELEFKQSGYSYVQEKREGLVAMYKQINPDTNKLVAYEVFVIQELPEGFVGPKKYPQPARENPPGKEQWGRLGWTIWHKEDADKKFAEMVARQVLKAQKE